MKMMKMDSPKEVPEVSCGGWVTVMPFRQNGRLEDSFYVREVAQFMEVLFLPAAKPAGLWIANVKLLKGVDTWLFGGLDAFRGMLAQVSELARIKYDAS